MPSFKDYANVPAQDVQPPKPLAVGDYIFLVDGLPEHTEGVSERTNEPYESYSVKCRPVSALDTVDKTRLSEALNGDELKDRPVTLMIFQPHIMKQFIDACGLIKGNNKKDLFQLISELPGSQFQGHITNAPGRRDKTQLFAQIDSFTAAK